MNKKSSLYTEASVASESVATVPEEKGEGSYQGLQNRTVHRVGVGFQLIAVSFHHTRTHVIHMWKVKLSCVSIAGVMVLRFIFGPFDCMLFNNSG